MNAATAIAIFLLTHPLGISSIDGNDWSYTRNQDKAIICINGSCLHVENPIVAEDVETTTEDQRA